MTPEKIFPSIGVILSAVVVWMYLWISSQNATIESLNATIYKQTQTIELAKKEYKKNLASATKEIVKIQTKYITQKEYIIKYEKVENENDCNATARLLGSFVY